MFEIVKAGGIVMVPLILCSILAAAITLERLWTLRSQRVVPEELVDKVWRWVENRTLSDKQILALQQHSPLGRVLAAGLANRHRDRSLMIEAIEDACAAAVRCGERESVFDLWHDVYRELVPVSPGTWRLVLEDAAGQWRLAGEWRTGDRQVTLRTRRRE